MEKLTITHSIKEGLKIKDSIPSDTVLELSVQIINVDQNAV
jgi:hypothetical protein